MIEGIARYFLVANHYIVASACGSVYTEFAQHRSHHIYIFAKCKANVFVNCYIREHNIIHVSIHTSASALASERVDVVLLAVFQIHLVLYQLVSPEYNGGGYLPHEEVFVAFHVARYILFHSKVEG